MKRKINSEILGLSLPNIISNISVPLLSTVDTILMGGLSSAHLGAVGLGSMLFNIIYWNFGFLRMGTTGITAQHYGGKRDSEIWISLLRAGILSLLLAMILILFQSPLYKMGMWSLNVSGTIDPLVFEYYKIRIWAAPASLMLMVVMGWFFGVQNAIYPLVLTVLINFVNIVLSYYLVVVKGLDVRGVAIGTVVAQYVGVLAGVGLILTKYKKYVLWTLVEKLKTMSEYAGFMKININLFLRTVCLTFAFGFFYSQSSKLGDVVLAVNVVLMQFVNWMSYGIDGFAYATESLVGKYKGAQESNNVKTVITQSFLWGGLVSLIYALVYYIFGNDLFLIFSDDESLITLGGDLLVYMAIFPILAFASYIWDGIFIGLTATVTMRNAMVMALLVFLGVFYLLPKSESGSHIWIALSVFMIARAFFQYLYYRKYGLAMS